MVLQRRRHSTHGFRIVFIGNLKINRNVVQSINGSLHGIGHFGDVIASHDLTAIRI
jgi:hypothetical protein